MTFRTIPDGGTVCDRTAASARLAVGSGLRGRLATGPVTVAATLAVIGLGGALAAGFTASVALAQTGDQDSKPVLDRTQNTGVSPGDVENLGKDGVDAAPPPPPRAQPAPQPAPPREARRPAPQPAPQPASLFAGSPYVWGSLGWVNGVDAEHSGAQSGEADIGDDIHYAGAIGWHFDNGLRAEIEANYFELDINGFGGVPVDGEVEVGALLFNVLYELPHTRLIHPYVGAGVGIADVDTKLPGPLIDGDDTVMAWQFIGGAAVDVTQNLALTVDYRYFETDDPDFSGVESEMSAHKVLAGIRFTFGGR